VPFGKQTPLLHHFHKGRRCRVVVVGQFQPEPVGFVFRVAAESHADRLVGEGA
jgi:hypothetical protein